QIGIDGIRAFTPQLRRAEWPNGFSPKGIKTYVGDRDPEAWLRVYTTAIKASGGNQNAMANYLPVVLSPTVQDWLTGLLANSINSWEDLCAKFINNFQGTFMKPGVEWDLYQIQQKKNESLQEYSQWFMKKKNTIPGVSDALVMASFRKGVKDPDLLKKLSRWQPEIVKELFDMAGRYASQEEAVATEKDDRPRQNPKKDSAKSSKPKDRKRKG